MRLSFTARLALLAITLAVVSSLAPVFLIWNGSHNNAIGALRRDTVEQSDELKAVYHGGGYRALRQAIEDSGDPDDDTLIIEIVDSEGNRLAGVGPEHFAVQPIATTPFAIEAVNYDAPWDGREAGFAIRRVGHDFLITGRLLDDWEQEQRTIARDVGLSILLAIATGIAAGLLVTRYVGRRLNRIADVVEGVAEGDFSRRVELAADGRDAFDRLAARLNAMLAKIDRLVAELRTVTDSLAHDLRSPLSRLRTKAETALLASDPRQQEAALNGLLAETDMVMRMLTTLLEISRAEAVDRDRFAAVDPADLILEIGELYAPVAEDAAIPFSVTVAQTPFMRLHRELMSQAIANLIDNALRHAQGGGIALDLANDGEQARITVADRGPGIGAEDREEALRRFGRLDRARSQPGAGLGLALVDAVARLHGGRLVLADNQPGLAASIMLPFAPLDSIALRS